MFYTQLFTSDPCHFTSEGEYTVEIPHGALGYHVQSSLASDLGLEVTKVSVDTDVIILKLVGRNNNC